MIGNQAEVGRRLGGQDHRRGRLRDVGQTLDVRLGAARQMAPDDQAMRECQTPLRGRSAMPPTPTRPHGGWGKIDDWITVHDSQMSRRRLASLAASPFRAFPSPPTAGSADQHPGENSGSGWIRSPFRKESARISSGNCSSAGIAARPNSSGITGISAASAAAISNRTKILPDRPAAARPGHRPPQPAVADDDQHGGTLLDFILQNLPEIHAQRDVIDILENPIRAKTGDEPVAQSAGFVNGISRR